MEMDTFESCDPDSTVEIIDVEEETVNQEQTPLQRMNFRLLERQLMCGNMVANSIRDRNRVCAQLEETRKRHEGVMSDYLQVTQSNRNANRSLKELKASLEAAMMKRCSLQKEIEREKQWRLPSAYVSLKTQQELREKVEQMRAIVGTGKICTPDD